MNIYDLISRAQKLRKETQLDSVSPDRVGGLHEDTLKYINEFQLLASSPSLHKIYASVSAMQSDKSPKSDLTGKPLKPGQLVVIVPANQTDATAGDVYRYDGPSGNTSAWTFVAKIGAVPADAELSATSTNPPQNKVVTEKLTELESKTSNSLSVIGDVNTTFSSGYINEMGSVSDSSYASHSDFVKIDDRTDYYITGSTSNSWCVAYYSDANESAFISSKYLPVSDKGVKLEIPTNAKYMRVTRSNSGGFIQESWIKVADLDTELTTLKSKVNESLSKYVDIEADFVSGYINETGGVTGSTYGYHSDFLKIDDGITYAVLGQGSNTWCIAYYSDTNESAFIGYQRLSSTLTEIILTIPVGARYMRVSKYINGRFCKKEWIKVSGLDAELLELESKVNDSLSQYLDVSTTFLRGYINEMGSVSDSSYASHSDFVQIEDKEYYILGQTSNAWCVGYYSDASESSFIGSRYLPVSDSGAKLEIPADAKYMRVTKSLAGRFCTKEWVKIGESNIDKIVDYYVGYGIGGQNHFDSVTECFYAAMAESGKRRIHINEGEYDIFSELGGYDYVNKFDSNVDDWMLIQPVLQDAEIIGYGKVVFLYQPEQSYSSSWLFAPLNVKGNIKIDNIEIRCSNCRYGIHDEDRGLQLRTSREYNNVRVFATDVRPVACGFSRGVKAVYKNCMLVATSGNVYSCHGNPGVSVNFENCILRSNQDTEIMRISQVYTHDMEVIISNTYVSEVLLSPEVQNDSVENKTSVRLVNTKTTFDNRYAKGQSLIQSVNTIDGTYNEFVA